MILDLVLTTVGTYVLDPFGVKRTLFASYHLIVVPEAVNVGITEFTVIATSDVTVGNVGVVTSTETSVALKHELASVPVTV